MRLPITVHSGNGCHVFDTNGKRYLDLIAGIGVNALGYCHPRITAALIEQASLCIHTSNLVSHRHQGALAEKLCSISGLDRALFTNSGTEAMEAALKAVRCYAPEKTRIVALHNSFHGRTRGSLAITGQPRLRQPFEPLGVEVTFVEPNDNAGLRAAIGEDTSAVVMETVLGEGGVYPLKESFLRLARELTTTFDVLLVADEIQCGLGRTGKHFAYQWAGIQPDIVTVAKPLAAGLPLGAALLSKNVAQRFSPCLHGTTFGGGPLACRVALEFLSMLDDLLPHICDIAQELRSGLEILQRRHPIITEIRSKGMMFGLQLSGPGEPIVLAALERGLLLNCTHQTVLRLLPPFILSREQAQEALQILDATLP